MKRTIPTLLIGAFIGAAVFGSAAFAASGILAERSTDPVYVDGKLVEIEAYSINDNNYMKLRDIGQAVGFNVYWDGHNVQIESDKPYTGLAPDDKSEDGAVTLPADGSQYVPQAGDIIVCDDGYRYTITDVSRWDKNMFASGSVGALPEATCDWSLLPQPELPDVEVRHFTISGSEYMFVRNLYETRRMLYTLYNAIGDNPETWQNGAPVAHPSGNPKVNINLTVADDLNPQSFWPWRASEIVNLFNSCPPGTYSMEAWDVYKDGVFQRTEYNIHVK